MILYNPPLASPYRIKSPQSRNQANTYTISVVGTSSLTSVIFCEVLPVLLNEAVTTTMISKLFSVFNNVVLTCSVDIFFPINVIFVQFPAQLHLKLNPDELKFCLSGSYEVVASKVIKPFGGFVTSRREPPKKI